MTLLTASMTVFRGEVKMREYDWGLPDYRRAKDRMSLRLTWREAIALQRIALRAGLSKPAMLRKLINDACADDLPVIDAIMSGARDERL